MDEYESRDALDAIWADLPRLTGADLDRLTRVMIPQEYERRLNVARTAERAAAARHRELVLRHLGKGAAPLALVPEADYGPETGCVPGEREGGP